MTRHRMPAIPRWSDVVDQWDPSSHKAIDNIAERVSSYFDQYVCPARGARILVALSGGSDSVALTTVLRQLSELHDWAIAAAHVNYGMRGAESDEDHAFCRRLSRRWGLRFHSIRVRPPTGTISGGVQRWARETRYRFFDQLADRHGYHWIALGHQIEDRAETVAAAVMETSGSFALSGIAPVRGHIIRPLFDCHRDDLCSMLEDLRIPWRIDSSNLGERYKRNRMRQTILPSWAVENPRIVDGLARVGLQLWEQRRYLEGVAERLVEEAVVEASQSRLVLDAGAMAHYDIALDPFVLRQLLRRLGLADVPTPPVVGQFAVLRRIVHGPSSCVEQGLWRAIRSKGRIAFECRNHDQPVAVAKSPKRTRAMVEWEGMTLQLTQCYATPRARIDNGTDAWMDWNQVGDMLTLRHPRSGDRYRPFGMNGTKKLADLLADRGVPTFHRTETAVLSDAEGILWPIGFPIAERARVTRTTRRILHAKVIDR